MRRSPATAVAAAAPLGLVVGEPAAVPLPLPGGSDAGNEPESGSFPSSPAARSSKLRSVVEEGVLGVAQSDPVLRPLRAGDRGEDVAEVELERIGEGRLLGVGLVEQSLLVGVGVDELDHLGPATGELEVAEGLGVGGEDRAGRAELRRHVPERRPVGEAERRQPRAVELDELADDAALAEHLGYAEDQVGCRRRVAELSVEPEPDHLRQQHRDRLAEHRRLRLDAADAPAEDAEAVDHGRVGVGPDQRVGEGAMDAVLGVGPDDPAEVLEVDLVADAGRGRHHAEVVEGLLSPAQELVALLVALELALGVDLEGPGVAEGVDLDGVVDDQIDGDERVDLRRVGAELVDRVPHRGEVDDGGDAGEVLHQDPGRLEGDLLAGLSLGVPGRDRLDVVGRHPGAVFEPEAVLEEDLEGVGKAGDVEA